MAAPAFVRDADPLAVANDGVLPTDVLYDVLLRVPAKALCRFRLVCRAWRALTSDPRFAGEHSSRRPLFAGHTFRSSEIHLVDMHSGDIVKRIDDHALGGLVLPGFDLCTNAGLVCGSANTTSGAQQTVVLDPATGVIDVLPDGGRPDAGGSPCIVGHVPSTGLYKVLRVALSMTPAGTAEQSFDVMTLGRSGERWRATPCPPYNVLSEFRYMAAVGGVAYFVACRYDDVVEPGSLALFDLATEEWRPTILLVPLTNGSSLTEERRPSSMGYGHIQIAGLNGCLVAIHHREVRSMDLWFLEDVDKEIWTKRYSMRFAPQWEKTDNYPPYPLVVSDDGRVIMWIEMEFVLSAYDPRTSRWEDVATVDAYVDIRMHEGSLLLCSSGVWS
ncbi:hypothetical protein ACP70R_004660 [Stipagrostis hirtigluma subsp. patula]